MYWSLFRTITYDGLHDYDEINSRLSEQSCTGHFSEQSRITPGSNPACDGIFPSSSHTCDIKIGTPVAALPGAWRYRVSAGTGWPGFSIM